MSYNTEKISKERWAYSWSKGKEVEDIFYYTMSERGHKVEKTNVHDDKMKHIDFYVNGIGVDIKASKSKEELWLEVVNVKGFDGWLKGEAKYIIFYINEVFYVFEREGLLDYVKTNVKETTTKKEYNKFYSRKEWLQDDVIVKVRFSDIEHLLKQTI